jgi:hypothetical protein
MSKSFKLNLISEINDAFDRISESKVQLSLTMPQAKIKKHKVLYNQGLLDVYDRLQEDGIEMKSLILCQSEYLEFDWLVTNVLNSSILGILKTEY